MIQRQVPVAGVHLVFIKFPINGIHLLFLIFILEITACFTSVVLEVNSVRSCERRVHVVGTGHLDL